MADHADELTPRSVVRDGRPEVNQDKHTTPSEPQLPPERAVDAGHTTLHGGPPPIEKGNVAVGAVTHVGGAVNHGVVAQGEPNQAAAIASSGINARGTITQDGAKKDECHNGQKVVVLENVQAESVQQVHTIVKAIPSQPRAPSEKVLKPKSSQFVKPTLLSGSTWKGHTGDGQHGSSGAQPQATVLTREMIQHTSLGSVQSLGSAAMHTISGGTTAVAELPETRSNVSAVVGTPMAPAPMIVPAVPPLTKTPQQGGNVPTPIVVQNATKKPCTPTASGAAQSVLPTQAGLPAAPSHERISGVVTVQNPQSASTRLEANLANSGSAAATQGSTTRIQPVTKPQSAPRQVVTFAGHVQHGASSGADEVDVDAQASMARSILPRPTPPVGRSSHAVQTIFPGRSRGGVQAALPSASTSRATQAVRPPAALGAIAGRVGRAANQPRTSTPIVRAAERSLAKVNPHANSLSVAKSIFKSSPMPARSAVAGAGARNRLASQGLRNPPATAPLITTATRIPPKNASNGPAPASAAVTVRQVAPLNTTANALFASTQPAHTVHRQNAAPSPQPTAALQADNGPAMTRHPPLATAVQNAVLAGNVQPYPVVAKGAPGKYCAPVAARGVAAQPNVRQSTQPNNGAVLPPSQRPAPAAQHMVPAVSAANPLPYSGGVVRNVAARTNAAHVAGLSNAATAPAVSQAVPGMPAATRHVESVVDGQAPARFLQPAPAWRSRPAVAQRNAQQTRAPFRQGLPPQTRPGEQALLIGPADLPSIDVMRALIPDDVWAVPLLPASRTQEHRISSILFDEQFVAAEKDVDRHIRSSC